MGSWTLCETGPNNVAKDLMAILHYGAKNMKRFIFNEFMFTIINAVLATMEGPLTWDRHRQDLLYNGQIPTK